MGFRLRRYFRKCLDITQLFQAWFFFVLQKLPSLGRAVYSEVVFCLCWESGLFVVSQLMFPSVEYFDCYIIYALAAFRRSSGLQRATWSLGTRVEKDICVELA